MEHEQEEGEIGADEKRERESRLLLESLRKRALESLKQKAQKAGSEEMDESEMVSLTSHCRLLRMHPRRFLLLSLAISARKMENCLTLHHPLRF